jgi:outer membrane protein TolC
MHLAEQNSHVLKAATFASAETHARLKQGWSALGPRLDVDSTLANISDSTNALVGKQVGAQVFPSEIRTASVMATQPLTTLGPLFLRIQAETLQAAAAEHTKNQAAHNAKFVGGEAFLRAAKAERLLAIAHASMAVAQKQKADGAALTQVGKLKNSDLLRLELAVSEAQTQLTQAESVRDVAFYTLAEFTGIAVSELEIDNQETVQFLRPNGSASTDALPLFEKAEANRAELKAHHAQLRSLELTHKSLWYDYFPQISLFARYEKDFAKKDIAIPPSHSHNPTTGAAMSGPQTQYSAKDIDANLSYGLTLRWNAWDWGSRWFRESEISAKAAVARENLEQLKQATRIEVMQAHRDLRAASDSHASAKATLTFAEDVYRQTNARFLMGMASVLDLTSAERDQTRARAALSNARGDWELAILKLKKVVGDDTL